MRITWFDWLIAAAPFAAILTVLLYFIMTRMIRPEMEEIAGGRDSIAGQLAALGPTGANEWKLLAIVLTLLGFWGTEKVLHNFDTSSTTVAAPAGRTCGGKRMSTTSIPRPPRLPLSP